MDGPAEAMARNGVQEQDVRALIGVLAVLEGFLMAGELPEHLTRHLQGRFVLVGLLEEGSSHRDLRQAINDMNHRLRYARGEYAEAPTPQPVPD